MTTSGTGIDALNVNLEDLQAELEATSRVASALQRDAATLDGLRRGEQMAEVIGRVVRHSRELRECMREQRSALRELRDNVARLRTSLSEAQVQLAARRETGKRR
jgi:chromosome segregation ATPase